MSMRSIDILDRRGRYDSRRRDVISTDYWDAPSDPAPPSGDTYWPTDYWPSGYWPSGYWDDV